MPFVFVHIANISIHAPRMGSDETGVTVPLAVGISIHAPRMGSDDKYSKKYNVTKSISIHAPRMGSDVNYFTIKINQPEFQSTLPAWGATGRLLDLEQHQKISIHAPRMGSDADVV